jgi:hypothetical protein
VREESGEAAKVIAETFGCEARRGCQFAGGKDSPDVVRRRIDGFHFEVKRVQRLNIHGRHRLSQ